MIRQTGATPEADQQALDQLVQASGGRLRLASVLTVLSSLLWPLQAGIVAAAIAGLLTPAAGPGPFTVAAGFIALGALRALLTYYAEGLLFSAGTQIVTDAREEIVRREVRSIHGGGAGLVASLAGEKLDLLLPYVTRYAPARARAMSVPLVILGLAFWQSWAVGLVFLITGPLIPVFMALIGLAAKQASQRQMIEIGSLNDMLIERLSALVDIRVLNAGPAVTSGFATAADRLRAQTMDVLRVAFLSSTVLELFSAIGVAMVAVYVGFSLLDAIGFGSYGAPLSPEAGIFLLLLTPEFYQPMRDVSAAWHDKAAALAVADELAAWRAETPTALLGAGAMAARLEGTADIVLQGVSVRVGDRLLCYPDLTIPAGAQIALTGPSGAGKTTLLRLIAGLLTPETGHISVGGQELDATTADAWRARLGWMPQSPHFLNESLARNISMGQAGNLDDALRAAAVEDVVESLPGGRSARLGETGGGLSGGEARRVTLARAIFAQPDVLLADEPTADLDPATRDAVMAGLAMLAARGCSLIIATHDPVLIARMDRTLTIGQAA